MIIPATYQLFGPLPGNGQLIAPGVNVSPDGDGYLTAYTANTKTFVFSFGYPHVRWARWLIIWACDHAVEATLQHMGDGGAGTMDIFTCVHEGSGAPRIGGGDITQAFNDMVDAGKYQHIAFRTKCKRPWILYESRLEVHWEIPQV